MGTKLREAKEFLVPPLMYVTRVSFGIMLLTSLLIVTTAAAMCVVLVVIVIVIVMIEITTKEKRQEQLWTDDQLSGRVPIFLISSTLGRGMDTTTAIRIMPSWTITLNPKSQTK